jgi:hypothetical protein
MNKPAPGAGLVTDAVGRLGQPDAGQFVSPTA